MHIWMHSHPTTILHLSIHTYIHTYVYININLYSQVLYVYSYICIYMYRYVYTYTPTDLIPTDILIRMQSHILYTAEVTAFHSGSVSHHCR